MRVVLLALGGTGLTACGECVFEQEVIGVVTSRGEPVVGATVSSCRGTRCEGDGDLCVSTTTGPYGGFRLEVPMCRPAAFECELAPVVVEARGCRALSVQTPLSPGELDLVLDCGT